VNRQIQVPGEPWDRATVYHAVTAPTQKFCAKPC
jgi:hypothetical protein